WGAGGNGQLGTGNTTSQPLPTQAGTVASWSSLAAGSTHALALRQNGTLWAWGGNYNSQVGNGATATAQPTPVQLGTATWLSISAGNSFSLAVRQDGTLWGWGSNDQGQLGLGTTASPQKTPTQIGTVTTWKSVSGGGSHTLAVRQDGTLWAWGYNGLGQLGTGNTTSLTVPTQIGTATNWQSVAAGSYHSLAVKTDGTLWAWGENDLGELGINSYLAVQPTPTQVGTATNWQSVAVGATHTAAVRADGSLWTWGDNVYGQLGYGSSANPVPLYIAAGGTVLAGATPTPAATAWSLAPNPAHGRAQLLGLPAGPVAGQLFDAQGRLVRTTTLAEVELEGLAPGLYLLRAAVGGATRTLRLVVE
ncbi:MAG: T9SS type A sorting domain-containing protein, partial [Hymenobacter sp.]